jgi:aspartyl-tRNA synthetase
MLIPSSLSRIHSQLLSWEGHLRYHQVNASLPDNEVYLTVRSPEHSRTDIEDKLLKKSKLITVLEFGNAIVAGHLENLLVSGHTNQIVSLLIKT